MNLTAMYNTHNIDDTDLDYVVLSPVLISQLGLRSIFLLYSQISERIIPSQISSGGFSSIRCIVLRLLI
jgi:hypothetical protein